MVDSTKESQVMILDKLREISAEVKCIPRIEARVDAMKGATQQLEMAMRETTAGLRTQAEAHEKLLSKLTLDVHQLMASMMGISNDVQSLAQRVKDLEKQTQVAFQQQMQLAKDIREIGERSPVEQFDRHIIEYRNLRQQVEIIYARVDEIETRVETFVDPDILIPVVDEVQQHGPWLRGIIWFLRVLLGLLATAAAGGLLWLLGQALLGLL